MQQLAPSMRDADVKLVDQYPLYELGGGLQKLKEVASRDASGPASPFDQFVALWDAGAQIDSLLSGTPFEVSYCRESAVKLRGTITSFISRFREKETGKFLPKPDALESWELANIKSLVEIFEHQFSAEVKKTATYVVPRRGIFDTERLVDNADEHLPDNVRANLPRFVLTEFRAAGRCLAFGLNAASAFHALRAAERALKQYYIAFLGEPKKEKMTMGLMASHLQDRIDSTNTTAPKPSQATIRTIQDVVTFDRNPLTHRELDLKEDDAAVLFNRAQGMISVMGRELVERVEELAPSLPFDDLPPVATTQTNLLAPTSNALSTRKKKTDARAS